MNRGCCGAVMDSDGGAAYFEAPPCGFALIVCSSGVVNAFVRPTEEIPSQASASSEGHRRPLLELGATRVRLRREVKEISVVEL